MDKKTIITFNELWKNHPTLADNELPCRTNGKVNFLNQCSIKLGVCLSRCGVNTSNMPGITHCGYHPKSQGHVIRAEELANSLTQYPIAGIQKVEPKAFKDKLAGRTGIIFFKDYWQREINGKKEEFRNRSGDHIDLWNGSRLTDWFS